MTGKAEVYKTKADKIFDLDKNQKDLYALNRTRITVAQISISSGALPSAAGSAGGTGNFLETQGDTMVGPIAFNQVLVSIINGRIGIGENDRLTASSPLSYSTYVSMTGAGTPDDLNWIDGAAYNGQLLFLQGTPTQVLNIINATYPSISDITGTGTVTVTTSADHGLSTGQIVNILQTTNFDVQDVTITVTAATTFTYSDAGFGTPESSGQVQDGNIVSNDGTDVVLDGDLTPFMRAGVVLIFDQLQEAFGAWSVYSRPDAAGGASVPDGTTENDHLQWDSGAWVARQSFEFGSTDTAMADNGFLRFLNDTIIIGARTGVDDGNLEIKITTQDEFDFTASNNADVELLLRSQHATEPDQLFKIKQGSGTNALANLIAPNNMSLTSNASTVNILLATTLTSFSTDIALNSNQIFLDDDTDSGIISTVDDVVQIFTNNVNRLVQSNTLFTVATRALFEEDIALEETATPTPATNTGYVYTKAVTTETHLFYVGDGVSEIDLTPSIGGFATKQLDNLLNPNLNAALTWDSNGTYDLAEQLFALNIIWTRAITFPSALNTSPNATFGGIGEDATGMWVNIGSDSETFRITSTGTELFNIQEVAGGSVAVFDTPSEIWFGTTVNRGEIRFSGGDLILDRGNAGTNDGVDIQTFGNTRLKITEAEIDASVDINLNGNELQNVENIHIGTKIIYDFGPANFIEFTSNGIFVETDNVSDDISLTTKGLTSDILLTAQSTDSDIRLVSGATASVDIWGKVVNIGLNGFTEAISFSGAGLFLGSNSTDIWFATLISGGTIVAPNLDGIRLFNDSDTNELSVIHDGGAVVSLEGGGGVSDPLLTTNTVAMSTTMRRTDIPIDGTVLGDYDFDANTSSGNRTFGQIRVIVSDNTPTDLEGRMILSVTTDTADTLEPFITLEGDSSGLGQNIVMHKDTQFLGLLDIDGAINYASATVITTNGSTIAGDLIPSGFQNLGSSSAEWSTVFFNTLNIGATQAGTIIEDSGGINISVSGSDTISLRTGGANDRLIIADADVQVNATVGLKLTGGKQIFSSNTTEIGYTVENTLSTIGTEGSCIIGHLAASGDPPSDALLNTDFGKTSGNAGIDGSIGVYHDTSVADAIAGQFLFYSGGNWYRVFGSLVN